MDNNPHSRTVLTTSNSPSNVNGIAPPSAPILESSLLRVGDGAPNIFNSLVHRARNLLNDSGPVSDRLPPPRSASAPASLLMATDELGSPTVIGSVSID